MNKKGNLQLYFTNLKILPKSNRSIHVFNQLPNLKSFPDSKRSQAAMEFLMTYGWAILAAVIAIGVLAYFGVFNPGSYVSNMVTVNQPFGSSQELSINTNSILFVLRNGGGSSADIKSINVIGCGTNSTAMTLSDGGSMLVTIPCSPVLTSGDKFKGDITINYRTGDKVIDLVGKGTVAGRVQ